MPDSFLSLRFFFVRVDGFESGFMFSSTKPRMRIFAS